MKCILCVSTYIFFEVNGRTLQQSTHKFMGIPCYWISPKTIITVVTGYLLPSLLIKYCIRASLSRLQLSKCTGFQIGLTFLKDNSIANTAIVTHLGPTGCCKVRARLRIKGKAIKKFSSNRKHPTIVKNQQEDHNLT